MIFVWKESFKNFEKQSVVKIEPSFTSLPILRRLSLEIAPLSAWKRRGAHVKIRAATSFEGASRQQ